MGRNDKLLDRIINKPKDFTYDELKRLLAGLQCVEDTAEERPVRVWRLSISRRR